MTVAWGGSWSLENEEQTTSKQASERASKPTVKKAGARNLHLPRLQRKRTFKEKTQPEDECKKSVERQGSNREVGEALLVNKAGLQRAVTEK